MRKVEFNCSVIELAAVAPKVNCDAAADDATVTVEAFAPMITVLAPPGAEPVLQLVPVPQLVSAPPPPVQLIWAEAVGEKKELA